MYPRFGSVIEYILNVHAIMFKKILRESIKEVAENHVLVRISFLTGFFHNLFAFAGIGRKINNILHYRYELTLDTFAIGNDIINFFVKN